MAECNHEMPGLPYTAFHMVNAETGGGKPSPYPCATRAPRKCRPEGRRYNCFSLSKAQDGQPRNIPKVPDIRRAYAVTKFECGHADQEIRESEFQSLRLIFAIELAGAESDRHRDRVDGHRADHPTILSYSA